VGDANGVLLSIKGDVRAELEETADGVLNSLSVRARAAKRLGIVRADDDDEGGKEAEADAAEEEEEEDEDDEDGDGNDAIYKYSNCQENRASELQREGRTN
jgi:hypothetical protein